MKIIILQCLIIAFSLAGNIFFVYADASPKNSDNEQTMYRMGNEAYLEKDYVSALKYLFAYRMVNEIELAKHKEFSAQIEEAIETSERKIREAIRFHNAYTKNKQKTIPTRQFRGAAF